MAQINYKKLLENSKLLECEEILVEEPIDIELSKLVRPLYHTRVPIENKVQVLANSLLSNELIGAILVSKDSLHVIDGWQRVELFKALGKTTIPCYQITTSSLEKEIELHLAINQQAAQFDLSEFGVEFSTIKLEDYGFSEIELNDCRATMNSVIKDLSADNQHPKVQRYKRTQINSTIETMEKINEIKSELKCKTNNQVIEHLINFYEKYKSNS